MIYQLSVAFTCMELQTVTFHTPLDQNATLSLARLRHLCKSLQRSITSNGLWTYQPKVLLISHSRAVRKEGQGRGHGNSKLIWDQREALCAVAACPLGCGIDGSRSVRPWCGRSLPSGLWPRWPVRHLCPSCVAQSRQADP